MKLDKTANFLIVIGWLFWVASQFATAVPPTYMFSTITPDATGRELAASMIWIEESTTKAGSVAAAFRRNFDLESGPTRAMLAIFADSRYVLWVNGEYVDRGPSRFQPNGPQYDLIDLTERLRTGKNTISVLVVGQLSGGKIMYHAPGLAAQLIVEGRELLSTDTTWKTSSQTRYRDVKASWADVTDSLVDARVENGDWTLPAYDDSAWKPAVKIRSESWGPLTRTMIPPLRESVVPLKLSIHGSLPLSLKAGEKLGFDTQRIVQAYLLIEFEASADTELWLEPFGVKYLAKAGPQAHFTIDTRGLSHGEIVVKTGEVTITSLKLIERIYPFERLGKFTSSDEYLEKLWNLCARSCEVLSEDSYVDCADRERVEWMDNTPPGFGVTQVAMAGPGFDGKPVYSDPRLLAALIRRTGLTLQPDGWVKAHTCSDRYDIHAKMEDRACDWIEGQRLYYEATGDISIARETWPAIVAQMNYFLDRRTSRGLVRARDWVVWGNPVGYMVGEGTTLNAFVQKALVDAAYLGNLIGQEEQASEFSRAADDLRKAINDVLWDEGAGAYHSGFFTDEDDKENNTSNHRLSVAISANLSATTLHANVFALDRGIVPPERRARVLGNILRQERDYNDKHIMVYYYIFKQMYDLDDSNLDKRVLDLFRSRWAKMVADPGQCSWEGFDWGSHAHIYGMFPGYFLSSSILGVRREAPVQEKTIVIEPHLGDLTEASGVVVTEFGPVSIAWKRERGELSFSCEVPGGVNALLKLPCDSSQAIFTLNGTKVQGERSGRRLTFNLGPGKHAGAIWAD